VIRFSADACSVAGPSCGRPAPRRWRTSKNRPCAHSCERSSGQSCDQSCEGLPHSLTGLFLSEATLAPVFEPFLRPRRSAAAQGWVFPSCKGSQRNPKEQFGYPVASAKVPDKESLISLTLEERRTRPQITGLPKLKHDLIRPGQDRTGLPHGRRIARHKAGERSRTVLS
jgi:hypothetical protein